MGNERWEKIQNRTTKKKLLDKNKLWKNTGEKLKIMRKGNYEKKQGCNLKECANYRNNGWNLINAIRFKKLIRIK